MKSRIFLSVWFRILLLVVCLRSGNAQDASLDKAIRFLESSKPMLSPSVELHFNDPAKRKAVEELYRSQMNAIGQLAESRNSSIIPVLIRYLNYTVDGNSAEDEIIDPPSYTPDIKTLCGRQPVFALILHIPGANKVLADYAADPKNQLRLRIAAFHVLRYVDQSQFNSVADGLNKELATAGPMAKARLKAIEDGSAPFDGISPIDTTR